MKTLDDELRKPTKQQLDEEKIARAAKKAKQEKREKDQRNQEELEKKRREVEEIKSSLDEISRRNKNRISSMPLEDIDLGQLINKSDLSFREPAESIDDHLDTLVQPSSHSNDVTHRKTPKRLDELEWYKNNIQLPPSYVTPYTKKVKGKLKNWIKSINLTIAALSLAYIIANQFGYISLTNTPKEEPTLAILQEIPTKLPTKYLRKYQLEIDDKPPNEVMIKELGGSGGDHYSIYIKKEGGWIKLHHSLAWGIRVLSSKHNGYRDLEVRYKEYRSGSPPWVEKKSKLKWNGYKYK